jgi:hypothetical protein
VWLSTMNYQVTAGCLYGVIEFFQQGMKACI